MRDNFGKQTYEVTAMVTDATINIIPLHCSLCCPRAADVNEPKHEQTQDDNSECPHQTNYLFFQSHTSSIYEMIATEVTLTSMQFVH